MKTHNRFKKTKITFIVVGLVTAIVLGGSGRANADFTFGEPTNLGPTVNTSAHDLTPRMPADGLSLYFASMRGGGSGGYDLWVTTRPTKDDLWDTPVNLGPAVNSSADDYSLSISADGLALYFVSRRGGGSGGYDLWVTTRPTKDDPWGIPVNLGQTVNSSANDYSLGISAHGRMLHFTSNRGGGSGGYDV
jgi:Tol biopolymer transport system component